MIQIHRHFERRWTPKKKNRQQQQQQRKRRNKCFFFFFFRYVCYVFGLNRSKKSQASIHLLFNGWQTACTVYSRQLDYRKQIKRNSKIVFIFIKKMCKYTHTRVRTHSHTFYLSAWNLETNVKWCHFSWMYTYARVCEIWRPIWQTRTQIEIWR